MKLHDVVATSEAVGATRSRLDKQAALAELLDRIPPGRRRTVVTWLAGELPQGRIGVGPALVRKVADTPPAATPSLTVDQVDQAFSAIAGIAGKGAVSRREGAVRDLLAHATPPEQHFLSALLVGELRQGALAGVMVEAVAQAAGVDPDRVRRALMLSGDLAATALAALDGGDAALDAFRLQVFRPIQPMLADVAEDVDVALAALGEARFDVKLDGARVQAHKDGHRVRVFTRHLREVTGAVPEVVEAIRALPVERAILDGEALALRPDGTPHPFQTTMKRFGRQKDVARARERLPLSLSLFDTVLLDEELLDAPERERFARLGRLVPEALLIEHVRTDDADTARRFLQRAIDRGHEGAMAKDPASAYQAGHRGSAWLKLKPHHTLDLVVLGAEWGSGRRTGTLSNLHLGARDGASFVMLGKTFKGLTDDLLAFQTEALLDREVRREGHVVHVRPELVVEIAFNEVQKSPRYPAGLALRFARVKAYRPDKTPAEADTLETVRAIHEGRLRPIVA
jgi:DNA ligase 1